MVKLGRVFALIALLTISASLAETPVAAVGCDYCKYFELGAMPDFGLEDESFYICWPHTDFGGPKYCTTYSDGVWCEHWGRCEVFEV